MSGHGWVTPNLDGSKARCGGPGLCSECSREALTEKTAGVKAARDYTDREKAVSAALHEHGLVFFPRDTAHLSVPPLYVVLSFDDRSRQHEGRLFDSIGELEGCAATLDAKPITLAAAEEIIMRGKPVRTKPYVGQMVHYVSHGTPVVDGTQAYPSACRAATVTEVGEIWVPEGEPAPAGRPVGLCVMNPTGQFFNQGVLMDPGTYKGGEREVTIKPGELPEALPLITCDDLEFAAGSWHFIPEGP